MVRVAGRDKGRDVFILGAVRTAIGRRGGSLSGLHANDLLGVAFTTLLERTGVDPGGVDQVVGGCVQQIGMQSANVTRNSWLTVGLPVEVPASTVNSQCGSSQQATTLAHGLVAGGLAQLTVACGVETMSAIPMGTAIADPEFSKPRAGTYAEKYESTSQFEGADRIAQAWEITREDTEAFGLESQERAAKAWADGRFTAQIAPVRIEQPEGTAMFFDRDECPRSTSLAALAGLRTNLQESDAVHTAGTSSQIADGAAAILIGTAPRAAAFGIRARARMVDSVLVGSDPELMLTGPIPATRELLDRNGLTMNDIDVFEVNEAFASVVLAWAKELKADFDRTNPNGGAIALGHPLGATGCILITKALHELERTGGRRALVTMCCGGGLGTGTILERVENRRHQPTRDLDRRSRLDVGVRSR